MLNAPGLFRALHAAEIDYVVIGGFAVIAHGVQRTTADLDICPDPDRQNLRRLALLLRQLDVIQVGEEELDPGEFPVDPTDPDELAAGGNFRLRTKLGDLDIMQWIAGLPEEAAYSELSATALESEVAGIPIRVCSLENLRSMKRVADRPQDRIDLERLSET